MTKQFTFLPHTADIGLAAFGKTLPELFENAARGMFALLSPGGTEGERSSGRVETSGIDAESLLVNWLSELLYASTAKKALPVSISVKEWSPLHIAAEVCWRKIPAGLRVQREIKAVTYHGLKVRQAGAGFEATIIFDV
ncbi:MAG: archease [Endomicrobiales bacterium]